VKVVAIISRDWSKEIILNLLADKKLNIDIPLVLTTLNDTEFDGAETIYLNDSKDINQFYKKIKYYEPSLILTYGWSHYLSKDLRDIAPCLVLHPSPLPLYRGGSPIQNQIIEGETKSAVSIIYAEDELDKGDILYQNEIDFTGYLSDILERVIAEGIKGTKSIIKHIKENKLIPRKQNDVNSSTFKRINVNALEIKLEDFKKKDAKYYYNLVRGFQHPYPKVYIKCKDNTVLYLEKVDYDKN